MHRSSPRKPSDFTPSPIARLLSPATFSAPPSDGRRPLSHSWASSCMIQLWLAPCRPGLVQRWVGGGKVGSRAADRRPSGRPSIIERRRPPWMKNTWNPSDRAAAPPNRKSRVRLKRLGSRRPVNTCQSTRKGVRRRLVGDSDRWTLLLVLIPLSRKKPVATGRNQRKGKMIKAETRFSTSSRCNDTWQSVLALLPALQHFFSTGVTSSFPFFSPRSGCWTSLILSV